MKKILVLACLGLALTATPSRAADDYAMRFAAATTDIFIARPFTFLASILGGAIWTASLPITLPTHTTKDTFEALVKTPWDATFDRDLGDFTE